MKRSIAISGPTPQFIRWAIEKDCGLRDLDPVRLPTTTFQQLRGIRAIATGIAENRTFKGFCFSARVDEDSHAENVKAIPVGEVLSLFGGEAAVADECSGCPANATGISDAAWAGCFGFLSADPDWCPEFSSPDFRIRESLVEQLNAVVAEQDFRFFEFLEKRPLNWYGVWQTQLFAGTDLENLHDLLTRLVELEVGKARRSRETSQRNGQSTFGNGQLVQLANAVEQCRNHGMKFHCELVPPGFSDGVSWTIQSHCGVCKLARDTGSPRCECCGSPSCPIPPKKCKVLGDRPYLLLHQIIGLPQTAELFHEYLDFRSGET